MNTIKQIFFCFKKSTVAKVWAIVVIAVILILKGVSSVDLEAFIDKVIDYTGKIVILITSIYAVANSTNTTKTLGQEYKDRKARELEEEIVGGK